MPEHTLVESDQSAFGEDPKPGSLVAPPAVEEVRAQSDVRSGLRVFGAPASRPDLVKEILAEERRANPSAPQVWMDELALPPAVVAPTREVALRALGSIGVSNSSSGIPQAPILAQMSASSSSALATAAVASLNKALEKIRLTDRYRQRRGRGNVPVVQVEIRRFNNKKGMKVPRKER